jgi:N,N'-diacetyllegionaminate synthase
MRNAECGMRDDRCLIIAEAGVNHNGDVRRAIAMVWAAQQAGADAIKFQAFRADALVTAGAPTAAYQRRQTGLASQHVLLRSLELAPADFAALKTEADALGIEFLASPFSVEDVWMLMDLGVRRLKIASPELTDAPVIEAAARSGLALLVSTGAASEDEIAEALRTIDLLNPPRPSLDTVTLLACVTRYPTPHHAANLRAMSTLRERFGRPVGYSDHTPGIQIAPLAVAAGAVVIEKHFTLDRRLPGPDHAASVEPAELAALVRAVRRTERALGNGRLGPDEVEDEVRRSARKSLVAARRIPRGAVIAERMLAVRRPGTGLPPTHLNRVVGASAAVDIEPDTPITEEMLCASWSSPLTPTMRRSA